MRIIIDLMIHVAQLLVCGKTYLLHLLPAVNIMRIIIDLMIHVAQLVII